MTIVSPNVGHVISSPEFAFGYKMSNYRLFDSPQEIISVDGKNIPHLSEASYSEDERIAYAIKHSKTLPKKYKVDYSAHDLSRGNAKFVVERAEMEGGSYGGIGANNDYPDELHIMARRLHPSGKYDPQGELIEFYYPRNIKTLNIHGKMQRIFI